MNSYFLSIVQDEKRRKKNVCSFYQCRGYLLDEEIREKFPLIERGDIVGKTKMFFRTIVNPYKAGMWDGNKLIDFLPTNNNLLYGSVLPLIVSDHEFNPVYWKYWCPFSGFLFSDGIRRRINNTCFKVGKRKWKFKGRCRFDFTSEFYVDHKRRIKCWGTYSQPVEEPEIEKEMSLGLKVGIFIFFLFVGTSFLSRLRKKI
jgi:hypothetical protein